MRLVPSRRHFLWAATFSAFVVVACGVFTKFFLHWIYRKPKLGGLEEARVWFFGKSMLVHDRSILSELDAAIQKSNISIWWTKWIELRLCLGRIEWGNQKLGAGSLYVYGCYPFWSNQGLVKFSGKDLDTVIRKLGAKYSIHPDYFVDDK